MKTLYTIFTLSCLLLLNSLGQDKTGKIVTGSTEITESSEFIARDKVLLQTGFKADATMVHFRAYLNPAMLINAEYLESGTEVDPGNRNSDPNFNIGSSANIFSVTPMGGAMYNVPIQIPPGTKGVQPQLSINYNSTAGNGLLGYGWNLSGMSAITRIGKTYMNNNGMPTGVNIDFDDEFALDGQRLLAVNSTVYGEPGEYKSEINNFSVINAYSTEVDDYLKYFVVTFKNGSKAYYGNVTGTDSKAYLKSSNSPHIISWFLYKTVDLFGNYIIYNYENNEAEGEIWLESIEYTGNQTTNSKPYNKVLLTYETRTDISTHYINGCKLSNNKLLKFIRTYAEGELVRKYELTYFRDTYTSTGSRRTKWFGPSKLNEIYEYNSSGDRYNSIVVGWGNESYDFTIKDDVGITDNGVGEQYIPIDYTGDGRTDMVVLPKNTNPEKNDFSVYEMTSSGSFILDKVIDYEVVRDGGSTHRDGTYVEDYNGTLVGDYNGDGKQDMLVVVDKRKQELIFEYETYGYFFDLFTSNGSSFNPIKRKVIDFDSGTAHKHNNYLIGSGDFNGDAISDVVTVQYRASDKVVDGTTYYTHKVRVHLGSTDATFTTQVFSLISGESGFGIQRLSVLDFNRDGLSDLMFYYDNGFRLHLNKNDNGVFYDEFSSISSNEINVPVTDSYINEGDFNGDGYFDILYWTQTDTWKIIEFNGLDFNTGYNASIYLADPLAENENIFCQVADFNGDGLSDVHTSVLNKFDPNVSDRNTYYATGNQTFITRFNSTDAYFSPEVYYSTRRSMDFNGDGKADLFRQQQTSAIECFNVGKSRKVTSIKDGNNVLTTINYQYLTDDRDDFYTKGNSASFPVKDIIIPLHAVKGYTQKVNNKTIADMVYSYDGLRVHTQGKGLLGFSSVSSSNLLFNQTKTDNYQLTAKHFYSYLRSSTIKVNGTTTASSLTNLVLQEHSEDDSYWPKIISTTEVNHLDDTEIISTLTYDDDHGNVTNAIKEFRKDDISKSGNGTTDAIMYTNTVYEKLTGATYKNVPGSISSYQIRNGVQSPTIETKYSYDGINLDYRITNFSTPYAIKNVYTFNSYGNLVSEEIRNTADVVEQTMTYDYDIKNRAVETITNSYNHKAKNKFDYRYGNKLSETNASGITTTYLYDGWGRLSEIKSGTGSVKTKTDWYTGDEFTDVRYVKESTAVDGSRFYEYYNDLGQVKYTKNRAFDGEWVYSESHYDTKGRLTQKMAPYKTGETKQNITYTYDDFNRITLIANEKEESIVSYKYDEKRKVKVRDELGSLGTSWKEYNSLGELTKAHDNGGDISYIYDALGNLVTINAPGSSTSITYDPHGCGLQLSLVDPDAGTYSYTYDFMGRLKTQTHPEGGVTTLNYDEIGRLETKDNSIEGTISYKYVTEGNGLGSIRSISDGDIIYEYEYNNLDQVRSYRETIDDNVYAYSYEYDKIGRVSRIKYPGTFAIKNKYNQYGYLNEVTDDDDKTIWKLTEINTQGQPKKMEYGSGINVLETEFGYDEDNKPDLIKTYQQNDPTQILQHLTYSWDHEEGTLTSRQDVLAATDESFTYDDLLRLETYQVDGLSQYTMQYNNASAGVIKSKTGLGAYYYAGDGAGTHALTNIVATNSIPEMASNQTIEYTSFNKIKNISEGSYEIDVTYGPDKARKITEFSIDEGTPNKKIFAGSLYEKEISSTGVIKELNYIPGINGEAAIFVQQSSGDKMYYIHKDYLGSYQTISDENGTIAEFNGEEQVYSFDPWGRRRNSTDWSYDGVPSDYLFERGFTGHEHLDAFSLINMNGRVYDPFTSTFLSPDPYVQAPDYTQNYNRYGYGFNNPLLFSDPTGEYGIVPIVIGAVIGTWMGGAAANDNNYDFTMWDYNTNTYASMAIGNIAGGTSGGIGSAYGGITGAFLAGAAGGAINGAGQAAINGGNGWDVLEGATYGGGYGAASGVAAYGVSAGISAALGAIPVSTSSFGNINGRFGSSLTTLGDLGSSSLTDVFPSIAASNSGILGSMGPLTAGPGGETGGGKINLSTSSDPYDDIIKFARCVNLYGRHKGETMYDIFTPHNKNGWISGKGKEIMTYSKLTVQGTKVNVVLTFKTEITTTRMRYGWKDDGYGTNIHYFQLDGKYLAGDGETWISSEPLMKIIFYDSSVAQKFSDYIDGLTTTY